MKFMWQLAQKNLGRNKSRTMISVIAIAVSVAIVIFARSFFMASLETQSELQIKYNSGHIRVVHNEYQVKEKLLSLGYPVDGLNQEGYEQMITDLQGIEGVKSVIPRLKFGTMVSGVESIESMLAIGVRPEEELAFTGVDQYLKAGRFVQPGQREVVMGQKLMEKLHLELGESFTLLFNTAFASLKGVTFTVVGTLESGIKLLDDAAIYLPLDVSERMLDMPDQVTELLVILNDKNQTEQVLPAVNDYLTKAGQAGLYTAIPWQKSSDIMQSLQASQMIYNLVYALIIFLGCFIVINTLLMIVNERTKEIGMMGALGLRPQDILKLFMVEGVIIGIIGSFVGVVLGALITKYFSVVGINLSANIEQAAKEVILVPTLYPIFSLSNLLFAFILGSIITAIASTIPARRAAHMKPTEALGKL